MLAAEAYEDHARALDEVGAVHFWREVVGPEQCEGFLLEIGIVSTDALDAELGQGQYYEAEDCYEEENGNDFELFKFLLDDQRSQHGRDQGNVGHSLTEKVGAVKIS